MADAYTHRSLAEVEDAAVKFGLGDRQEAHFANEGPGDRAERHQLPPGQARHATGFGHKHDEVEEVYVVVGGSGRVKLDDDVLDVERLDAVRVSAGVTRAFEAGDEGIELVAFSPRRADDRGEVIQDWWSD